MKINVGRQDHQKTYFIHSGILKAKSSFFRGCLDGSFIEAQKNEINLPEDEPELFHHVLACLYNLPLTLKDDDPAVPKLIYLYSMADRLMLTEMRNHVVDALYDQFSRNTIRYATLRTLSECGLHESKAMDFLADEAGRELSVRYESVWSKNEVFELYALSPALVKRVLDRWHTIQSVGDTRPAACHYHEHETDEDRAKCKETEQKK